MMEEMRSRLVVQQDAVMRTKDQKRRSRDQPLLSNEEDSCLRINRSLRRGGRLICRLWNNGRG